MRRTRKAGAAVDSSSGPLRVIDGEQQRAQLPQAAQQPKQPMQQRHVAGRRLLGVQQRTGVTGRPAGRRRAFGVGEIGERGSDRLPVTAG